MKCGQIIKLNSLSVSLFITCPPYLCFINLCRGGIFAVPEAVGYTEFTIKKFPVSGYDLDFENCLQIGMVLLTG